MLSRWALELYLLIQIRLILSKFVVVNFSTVSAKDFQLTVVNSNTTLCFNTNESSRWLFYSDPLTRNRQHHERISNSKTVSTNYIGSHFVFEENNCQCLTIVNVSQENAGLYVRQHIYGNPSGEHEAELEVFGIKHFHLFARFIVAVIV